MTKLELLRFARARITDPMAWRRGGHIDEDKLSDEPPYCAGSALWVREGVRAVESGAIRALLASAGMILPDPPDEDDEIDALVNWNDTSTHATVLAAFDAAIRTEEERSR
jgi:hypothetical protein